jgi:hypothetical protein
MTTFQKAGIDNELLKLQEIMRIATECEKLRRAMTDNATQYGTTPDLKWHYIKQAKIYEYKFNSLLNIFDHRFRNLSSLVTVLTTN